MRSKFVLAAAIALTLLLGVASCTFVTQEELDQVVEAHKEAERELAKTKKKLKAAQDELANLKKQYAEGSREEESLVRKHLPYTPPKGNVERKAILDAIRRDPHVKSDVLFIVHHLKVQSGYAYAIVELYPKGQGETGFFLLRKKAGTWGVIDMPTIPDVEEAGFELTPTVMEEYLQKKHPDAPPEIFK